MKITFEGTPEEIAATLKAMALAQPAPQPTPNGGSIEDALRHLVPPTMPGITQEPHWQIPYVPETDPPYRYLADAPPATTGTCTEKGVPASYGTVRLEAQPLRVGDVFSTAPDLLARCDA